MYSSQESFEKWKDRISDVKKEDVENLAKEILVPENLRFAGIGPKIDEDKLREIIE